MSGRRRGPLLVRPGRSPRAAGQAHPPGGEVLELTLDAQSDEGRGLGRVDGKRVFVRGGLPGERVQVRIERRHRHYDEARLLQVIEPAPSRREPPCAVFGHCGGCSLQHQTQAAQLAHREATLRRLLRALEPLQWEAPITGPEWAYRHRARLLIRDGRCGFRASGRHELVDGADCAVLMPALLPALRALRQGLAGEGRFQQIRGEAHLACADVDDEAGGVGLLLDLEPGQAEEATAAALALARLLADQGLHCAVRRGGDWLLRHPVLLAYPGSGAGFHPGDFTQANPVVNAAMVSRALDWLRPQPGQAVADFFCGLGNFSLPLARRGGHVRGYDLDAAMLQRARQGLEREAEPGVVAQFMAVDLFAPPASLVAGLELAVLDPPRAGAEALCRLLASPDAASVRRLVYVSCDPHTLARDAAILRAGGLRPVRAALADMFPQTSHAEALLLFERGPGA